MRDDSAAVAVAANSDGYGDASGCAYCGGDAGGGARSDGCGYGDDGDFYAYGYDGYGDAYGYGGAGGGYVGAGIGGGAGS